MSWLSRCCCCIPLRAGGILIGVLALIWSVSSAFGFGAILYHIFHPTEESEQVIANLTSVSGDLLPGDIFSWPWATGYLVISVILTIFSVLLIWGAIARQRKLLIPYLVTDSVRMVLSTVLSVLAIVKLFGEETSGAISIIVSVVIAWMINAYIWACVISLYQKLKEEKMYPRQGVSYSYVTKA